MRKMTWEVAKPSKARCETCKGDFGLIRHRYANKQFCSKHCVQRHLTSTTERIANFKRWIDFLRNE